VKGRRVSRSNEVRVKATGTIGGSVEVPDAIPGPGAALLQARVSETAAEGGVGVSGGVGVDESILDLEEQQVIDYQQLKKVAEGSGHSNAAGSDSEGGRVLKLSLERFAEDSRMRDQALALYVSSKVPPPSSSRTIPPFPPWTLWGMVAALLSRYLF
jgi:hypothetical protein